MIFGIIKNVDPYNVFWLVNIPVLLKTGFVLQGHIYIILHYLYFAIVNVIMVMYHVQYYF